ncbi:AAA family ATPase [Halomonas sp. TRM85114]|uniref:AAA family ATPase n=1 Tax=Halomonas jincaotanensis TaxID=2810616 RepID=UPI001BD49AEB|nr:bifunctional aminoglycoside phosphotransferase/ATP-binding protein [Halomonas jincaotanensis]MBS9403363.1 AAA family ATPase [Halomonas jincaotanensis]
MSLTRKDDASSHDVIFEWDALVDDLVAYHRTPTAQGVSADDGRQATNQFVHGEIAALREHLAGAEDGQRLAHLEHWLEEELGRLAPVMARRNDHRRRSWAWEYPNSRLCHQGRSLLCNAIGQNLPGDGEGVMLDAANDLASLLVRLELCGEPLLAHRALDRYLRLTGDYELTQVLSLFRVCQALAGARRVLQRLSSPGQDPEHPALLAEIMGECRQHFTLAERYANFRFPPLVISVGVPGSGKSRFTVNLVERLGAIRLCSDVERRRLAGIDPQAESTPPPVDIFTAGATEQTYQRLAELAGISLDAGLSVCVDGTFLRRWQRDLLRQQAEARGLPCLMVSFEVDEASLRRRIEKRARRHQLPVEESLSILTRQMALFEAFGDEERLHLVHLDTTADNATDTLVTLIQRHII